MRTRERIVVDTNALVSRLLLPRSVPGQTIRKAVDNGILLVSETTMNELADARNSTATSVSKTASNSCASSDRCRVRTDRVSSPRVSRPQRRQISRSRAQRQRRADPHGRRRFAGT
jgi:hypothetical protein